MTKIKSAQDKAQINKRVQARYDFLMERGQHGHYETMFKCVHEELKLGQAEAWEAGREAAARICDPQYTTVEKCDCDVCNARSADAEGIRALTNPYKKGE